MYQIDVEPYIPKNVKGAFFDEKRVVRLWGLADDLEHAAPARKIDERVNFAGMLSPPVLRISLLGEGWRIIGVMLLQRKIDDQRLADDGFTRNEAPVTAVFTVVAVVAHNKVIARRNDEFAVFDQ